MQIVPEQGDSTRGQGFSKRLGLLEKAIEKHLLRGFTWEAMEGCLGGRAEEGVKGAEKWVLGGAGTWVTVRAGSGAGMTPSACVTGWDLYLRAQELPPLPGSCPVPAKPLRGVGEEVLPQGSANPVTEVTSAVLRFEP